MTEPKKEPEPKPEEKKEIKGSATFLSLNSTPEQVRKFLDILTGKIKPK